MNEKVYLSQKHSKIIPLIKNSSSFAFIFPYHTSLTEIENERRFKEMSAKIKDQGFGFGRMYNSLNIKRIEYKEKILFIKDIPKMDVLNLLRNLGEIYFIYKDDNEFFEYKFDGKAVQITDEFDINLMNQDFVTFLNSFLYAVSLGTNRNVFLDKAKINYIHEPMGLSFNQMAYHGKRDGDEDAIILIDNINTAKDEI
jgi:hypothetical protein